MSAASSSGCRPTARSGSVDLASELGVSPATVRRDLVLMEEQRLLARTHGGAVAQGVLYELPLRYRGARRHEEKARIAARGGRPGGRGLVGRA